MKPANSALHVPSLICSYHENPWIRRWQAEWAVHRWFCKSWDLLVCGSVPCQTGRRVWDSRVCQYIKGLLISSSSSGSMKTLITRHLPFLFFSISSIFRFFSNKNWIFCFYIDPAPSSFWFYQPLFQYTLTYGFVLRSDSILAWLR